MDELRQIELGNYNPRLFYDGCTIEDNLEYNFQKLVGLVNNMTSWQSMAGQLSFDTTIEFGKIQSIEIKDIDYFIHPLSNGISPYVEIYIHYNGNIESIISNCFIKQSLCFGSFNHSFISFKVIGNDDFVNMAQSNIDAIKVCIDKINKETQKYNESLACRIMPLWNQKYTRLKSLEKDIEILRSQNSYQSL